MSIYDATMKYRQENVPLVVLAGKEYGTGSSRDWAAKGVLLLGVKAVLAESFERIAANKDGQLSVEELRAARSTGHHRHHGRLDVNNDGSIPRHEAKSAPRLAQNFDAMDANRGRVLTRDEMHARRKAQPRPTPSAPVEPVKP